MSVTISGDGTITVSDGSNTTTIDTTTVKTQNIKHPSATPNNIALSSKEWYGFYAFPGQNDGISHNAIERLECNRTFLDDGNYDTSVYGYIVPKTGAWFVHGQVNLSPSGGDNLGYVYCFPNNGSSRYIVSTVRVKWGNQINHICFSNLVQLTANDRLELWIYQNGGVGETSYGVTTATAVSSTFRSYTSGFGAFFVGEQNLGF
jgi:hypothetical protein